MPLSVSMERMERCIPISEAHTGLWTEWPLICLNLKGEHMVGVSRLLMLIPMIGMQVITISNLNGIDLAPGCCNWTPRPSLPGSPELSLIRFLSLSFAFLSLTRFLSFFLCHSALTLSLSLSPSTKPGCVFFERKAIVSPCLSPTCYNSQPSHGITASLHPPESSCVCLFWGFVFWFLFWF